MENLKTLEDLFHHQLRDIYNAETQITNALPEMMEEASDENLKQAFKDHLDETKNQVARLEKIGDRLDIDLTGVTCDAMKGLIEESKELVSKDADNNVRDAGIIADAQRIEHYEISAYGTVREYAKALDKREIADQLNQTLQEESSTDEKLNKLAIDAVNPKAKVGG